jgi:hypothetical protein
MPCRAVSTRASVASLAVGYRLEDGGGATRNNDAWYSQSLALLPLSPKWALVAHIPIGIFLFGVSMATEEIEPGIVVQSASQLAVGIIVEIIEVRTIGVGQLYVVVYFLCVMDLCDRFQDFARNIPRCSPVCVPRPAVDLL